MTKHREFPMLILILPILINLKDLLSVSWQFSIETYLYFSAVPKYCSASQDESGFMLH